MSNELNLISRPWFHTVIAGLVVFLSAIVVHHPVINGEFLDYDDPTAVTENEMVLRGLDLVTIRWSFTTNHFSNWMPLTWLSLMLDTTLFGTTAKGYHFTNLILHGLSATVLVIILLRLSEKTMACIFVALLFAVHPINVQSVAWIAERKGLLSSFFWLLGILAYTFYAQRKTLTRYVMVTVCLILSLLSKQMAVTFAIGLLLIDYWPLHRLQGLNFRTVFTDPVFLEKLPLFAIGGAFVGVGFLAQYFGGALGNTETYPIHLRLANAAVGFAFYLKKALLPNDLQFHYHNNGSLPSVLAIMASIAIIALLLVISYVCRRSRPWLVVGFGWYAVSLLPVIGFLQIGVQRFADRYAYIPLIGVFVVVGALVFSRTMISFLTTRGTAGVALAIVLLLGATAYRETHFWHDNVALYTRAIQVDPYNPIAYNRLGESQRSAGEYELAIASQKKAFELDSTLYYVLHDLGLAYSAKGDSEAAITSFLSAIDGAKQFPEALNSLAGEYLAQGKTDIAIKLLEDNLKLFPNHSKVLGNLGGCYYRKGEHVRAVEFYRKAVESASESSILRFQLSKSLYWLRRWKDANTEFSRTLALSPTDTEVLRWAAFTLAHLGDHDQAMECLRQVVSIEGPSKRSLLQIAFLTSFSDTSIPNRDSMLKAILEKPGLINASGWYPLTQASLAFERGDYSAARTLIDLTMAAPHYQGDALLDCECKRMSWACRGME